MLGALPAALTYYWRRKMPETARYTVLVAKDAKQVAADMSKVLQVQIAVEQEKVERLGQDRKNQNLFQKDIFSVIGWIPPAQSMNALEEAYRIARAQRRRCWVGGCRAWRRLPRGCRCGLGVL
ncbi:hypothetical protein Sjap_021958 [Stephania japonica]|uniref:Uncharacterized protein n=1 Tax=Stephania japonica TaxID=461633 RepID=A0AAP0ENF1_9MAGN